jgi:hypothetical protein
MRVGPLFTEYLYNQGRIPTATFSLAMNGFSSDKLSFIDFGDPVESRIKPGAGSRTLGVNDDFFWSVTLSGVDFGDE